MGTRKFLKTSGISLSAGLICLMAVPLRAEAQASEDKHRGSETVLPQLVVVGDVDPPASYAGGQVASGTRLGILGNLDFMDTPFNATGYTTQYMEDIQAKTLQDVLVTDPTVRFQYPQGAMVESMYIRGFTYNINNSSLNGMMGMAPGFSAATEMLERIEVLRGPSAFLNGLNPGSEPNGGVNMVVKRALSTDLTRLSADYASKGEIGTHVDLSRRFGQEKQFGLRFNGVVRGGDTTVEHQHRDRRLGSLALDYTTDRVKLNLDVYQFKNKFDGAGNYIVQAVNRAAANIQIPKAPKYDEGIKNLSAEEESRGIILQGEFKFSDRWTGYAGVGQARTTATGFYGGGTISDPNAMRIGTLRLDYQNAELDKTAYQAGVRGMFDTGPIQHNVVLDWSRLELTQHQLNGSVPGSSATIPGVSIHDPSFDTSMVPRVKPPAPKLQEQELSSISLADTMAFADDMVQLTVGTRYQSVTVDTFNQTTGLRASRYDKSTNSPMYSLVLKPLEDRDRLAFYVSYIEGLQRGPTAPNNATIVNAGQGFAPYETTQYELGAKWNLGRFTNTLSFYKINRPSYIAKPVGGGLSLYTEDGEQRNRGVEWMFFGEVSDSVRLLGGVAYTKTKLVKTNNGVNEGNEAGGFPKWQANVGAEWDTFFDRNLTLTAQAHHNGSMYANSTNSKKIPGWTTYDLGARYHAIIGQKPVTFRLNVDNVFDKQEFWAGARTDGVFYVAPGRTLKLSASVDF